MFVKNLEELRLEEMRIGESLPYVFFWVADYDNGYLSQWYPSFFEYKGNGYLTAEHWMMAEKARLFNDYESFNRILKTEHPIEVKKLGRRVKNFDPVVWNKESFDIVARGNYLKFIQNTSLLEKLLSTKSHVLVEASPYDKIWGIGLYSDNSAAKSSLTWKGKNKLGFAIMKARLYLGAL